jgi:hypothetical protein
MPAEAVEALSERVRALQAIHVEKKRWNEPLNFPNSPETVGTVTSGSGGAGGLSTDVFPIKRNDYPRGMQLTQDEGNAILDRRIAAIEAEIKELGWSRTIKVESQPQGDPK